MTNTEREMVLRLRQRFAAGQLEPNTDAEVQQVTPLANEVCRYDVLHAGRCVATRAIVLKWDTREDAMVGLEDKLIRFDRDAPRCGSVEPPPPAYTHWRGR